MAVLTVVTLVSVPLVAAVAAVPPPPALTPTAARPIADGGPASLVPVDARTLTTAANGDVFFYDKSANQIRKVDASTHVVSIVAGNGQLAWWGALDPTSAALDEALPAIQGLWTDAAGDVFAWLCADDDVCTEGEDVYRLGADDGHWHLALADPKLPPSGASEFSGFAVTAAGDILAVDTQHSVIRTFAAGADPHSSGTVIAGTLDTPGSSGDGGPATAASITPGGPIAVSADGTVYFADGGWQTKVRRVDPAGQIDTLPDPGVVSDDPGSPSSIIALAVSGDAATLYALRQDGPNSSVLRAVPVDGSTPRTVAGPLPACGSDSEDCLGTSLAEVADGSTTSVAVAGQGAILSWPADGSTPQAYHRFAGILNDAKGLRSPDGTPLSETFLSPMYDLAASPSGAIAVATADGIRTISGLTDDATLGTAIPGVSARSLTYAADGTLYASVADPAMHVIAAADGQPATTVLGGGQGLAADGTLATDVELPSNANYAVDPTTDRLYFDTGDATIWTVDPSTGIVHSFADVSAYTHQPAQLAVMPDGAVLVAFGDASLLRVESSGVSLLDCPDSCPTQNLHTLGDGTIVGEDDQFDVEVRAIDGTVQKLGSTISPTFAVTADNRLVVPDDHGSSGGLLAVSGSLSAPTSVDAPAVQVTPTPGGIDVAVTPQDVPGQHIKIYAGLEGVDGFWLAPPSLRDDTTIDDSAQPYDRVFDNLFSTWPNRPLTAPATVRVEVVASEVDDSSSSAIIDSPQVFHVQPQLDTVAPAPPALTLYEGGTSVNLKVTPPGDADLDRVVVCKTTSQPAPTGPWGCDDVGEVSGSTTLNQLIDPLVTTTFTAFAIDASGNASAGASVSRPAAHLVTGAAVASLGDDPKPGAEEIVWQGGWALHVRYRAGSTPPATMTDGTEAGQQDEGGEFGYRAVVPVATGKTVAVSIFTYGDDTLTTYKRSSFVVIGGSKSDTMTLAATLTVNPGSRPAVSATFLRHSPTGETVALAHVGVYLYKRMVGTSSWSFVTSALTSTSGRATFSVPALTAGTYYEARYYPLTSEPVLTSTPSARTSVRQILTASVPTTARKGHSFAVTGTLAPHHIKRVYLQRYEDGHWVTLAYAVTASSGSYRIAYTPKSTGTWKLRVEVPATTTLLAGVTTTRSIKVS